jgi:tetratricopeptide (TPR) repeat protein
MPPVTRAPQARPASAPPVEPEPSAPPELPPQLLGLEPTNLDAGAGGAPSEALDIEPTALDAPPPSPPPSSIIEQEASASLLPEHELLDEQVSEPPPDSGFEPGALPAPANESPSFDLGGNTFDFGVASDDPGPLHDLAASGESSDEVPLWQQNTTDVFGGGGFSEEPPLLRSDAIGLDDPLASSNGAREIDGDSALLDFDSNSLGGEDMSPIPQGPAALRRHTISAERSVETLQASVEADPENWALRRELAEKMLESGDREGGIRELESAMMGAERANELDLASSLAEEIARLAPETVRFHQKRVEYAFRTNDKLRLIEAYLALAGALLNSNQNEKARAVYQRVLDLSPDDIRAQAALESIAPEPATPAVETPTPARKAAAPRAASPSPVRTRSADPEPSPGESGFVNLGDLLRVDDSPRSTRMIVEEQEPSGDEEADFADMLKKFKQGIAENVAQEDYQSHYDLGVAFKEMGLVDEAIAEFQKALKAPSNRLPTYEAIGQCFIEKEQYAIASTVLGRALGEGGYGDEELIGVLYLLGRAAEAQNRNEDALSFYQRIFVVDIEFRDVANRIRQLGRVAR